ncbi:DUF6907 domain-containing protein [Microbacterium sp. LMI1-1-1.1]|uniref:DUF6907 domain-containing protein n=1 Tax=Microbacterium sp. LMI1-1-1.1 TaxID=3135223 RepID=UPI003465E8D4
MSRQNPLSSSPAAAPCAHPWCVTAHGRTLHPDDETHRSAGVAFEARVRRADGRGPGRGTTVEVGVLRRPDDDGAWLVLDDGGDVSIALSAEGARELRRLLNEDDDVRSLLDGPQG